MRDAAPHLDAATRDETSMIIPPLHHRIVTTTPMRTTCPILERPTAESGCPMCPTTGRDWAGDTGKWPWLLRLKHNNILPWMTGSRETRTALCPEKEKKSSTTVLALHKLTAPLITKTKNVLSYLFVYHYTEESAVIHYLRCLRTTHYADTFKVFYIVLYHHHMSRICLP